MELKRQIKIKDAYCQLIRDLAFDYDGCETVESLKSLIDELSAYAYMAIQNDDTEVAYTNANHNYNILGEELKESD